MVKAMKKVLVCAMAAALTLGSAAFCICCTEPDNFCYTCNKEQCEGF